MVQSVGETLSLFLITAERAVVPITDAHRAALPVEPVPLVVCLRALGIRAEARGLLGSQGSSW